MSFSQQLNNYLLGTWITQQTTYNLISNTVNSIKMHKILKENMLKTLPNELNELHTNQILRRYFKIAFLSKDSEYNMYVKCLEKKEKLTKTLVLLNYQDNTRFKKSCYLSANNSLCVYTQYSRFYILEKFWSINQNLVLSVNLIFINRCIISIIFESRIRASKK